MHSAARLQLPEFYEETGSFVVEASLIFVYQCVTRIM